MVPVLIITFAWVHSIFFTDIDASSADRYYDLLTECGKPSKEIVLDLGIKDDGDLRVAVDRIKRVMGLGDRVIGLGYDDNEKPPAHIENINGAITIYLSRKVSQKREQVNVLTHELCHIYVWDLDKAELEGYDEEKVVDSAGVFLGLGILMLNGLTDDVSFAPGGEYRTEKKFFGYITPEEIGYLLARYCADHGVAEGNVMPFLGSAGKKYFEIGYNYLARQGAKTIRPSGGVTGIYWCPECGTPIRVPLEGRIRELKCQECSWNLEGIDSSTPVVSGVWLNARFHSFMSSPALKKASGSLDKKISGLVSLVAGADSSVFFFLNRDIANPACDAAIKFFMKIPGRSVIILMGAVVLLAGERYQKYSALIALSSYTIAGFVYKAIKSVIGRPRPFESLDNVRLMMGTHDGFSFPSGHATISFCLATVIAMRYPKARYPVFLAAALVAISRTYLGFHYPSDILTGALLGMLIGYIVTETANKCDGKRKGKKG